MAAWFMITFPITRMVAMVIKDDAARFLLPREPSQHVLQAFGLASFGFIKQVVSEPLAVGWNVLPALHVRHAPPLQHRYSLERCGTPSGRSARTRSAVVLIAVRIGGWSSKLNGSASS